ncbi:response regulator transcription factor [Lachnospiraceae bacterium 54-53]
MENPIRILIADDFPLLLEDMCEIINSQPDMLVAGTALSGQKIVELASEVESDIILMDIEMENLIAGITATEQIHDRDPSAKVIFLTAHETDDIIINAMATGAVDYIVKGRSEEELLHHIRSAHSGNPVMKGEVQQVLLQEYKRLQESEKSLLFFINNISRLTSTERILVRFLQKDMKVNEIARERCVEVVTIKTQMKGLLRKFGCTRTREIVKIIRELNLSHLF